MIEERNLNTMNVYMVSFLKKGELRETTIRADTADDARNKIAERFNIPTKFEFGTWYMNENNHVSAVIQISPSRSAKES